MQLSNFFFLFSCLFSSLFNKNEELECNQLFETVATFKALFIFPLFSKRVPMPPYHKPSASKIVCKYYLQGGCTREKCPFEHSMPSSKGILGRGPAAPSGVLVTMLKLVFEKQQHIIFDNESNTLNLSLFKKCDDVRDVLSSIDFNVMTFCDALCKTVKECIGSPRFIKVDGNNIKSLMHFLNALKHYELHVSLAGLSAADNDISTLDFATQLKSFPNLVEIVFLGNPVTRLDSYRSSIRKYLPRLLGLDKEPLQRPPLSLPWPIFPNLGPQESRVLITLEERLFQCLACQGVDGVADLYSPSCYFSLSLATPTSSWTSEKKSDALKDIVNTRLKQQDNNHNLTIGQKSTSVGVGRTEALSKMSHCLYPSQFSVSHVLHRAATVSFFGDLVPFPFAVATVSGAIHWQHKRCPDVRISRCFSRCFTLMLNVENEISCITNDAVLLSPLLDEPFFFAANASRVEKVSRRFSLPGTVVESIVAECSNDLELNLTLEDLASIPQDALQQCMDLAGQVAVNWINAARIVSRTGMTPGNAYVLLQQLDFDMSKVDSIVTSGS